jgi:hypothetical protein
MKKILLSLICFTFLTGLFAQSLSLQDTNGVAINSGSVFQILGDPSDNIITAKIDVKNTSAEALEVKVKKIIHAGDTLAGTMNYFCWGLCYGPDTYESPFPRTIEAGALSHDFYGDYSPVTVPGKSRITYVFFNVADRNDSVYVIVEFNASPASVKENLAKSVKVSEAYPNPATESVNVDYVISTSVNKASIILMNMMGSKVKEVKLDNRSGKSRINVSDLMNGVYFYSLVADDQVVITRKFVVKR